MMKTLLLSLTMVVAFATQAAASVTLNPASAQAAGMGSYTGVQGEWELMLIDAIENPLVQFNFNSGSYNKIAGSYDASGIVFSNGAEIQITEGAYTITYVSAGTEYAVYNIAGSFSAENGETYTFDANLEVLPYDYLYYLYYEMGVFTWDMVVIVLDDAPANEDGDVVEVLMTGGNYYDYIDSMGALQIVAENEDGYLAQLIFDAEDVAPGTYNLSQTYTIYCYLADMNAGVYAAYFKSGTATLTQNANGSYSVDATLLAKGGDYYHLSIPVCVPDGEDYHDYLEDATSIATPSLTPEKATKRFDGRQIIIEHQGRTYNQNGSRIK